MDCNGGKSPSIVGVGLRLPFSGESRTTFLQVCADACDCLVDTPLERWDSKQYCDVPEGISVVIGRGGTVNMHGAFLQGVALFDFGLF